MGEQHKSKQGKNLLARVEMKSLHVDSSNFEDSLLPKESNEDLLVPEWDDVSGPSLEAKKVKEAKQLEMEVL